MIQTAIDYAKELHKAGMTHEELSSVKDIFDVVPQVKEELNVLRYHLRRSIL